MYLPRRLITIRRIKKNLILGLSSAFIVVIVFYFLPILSNAEEMFDPVNIKYKLSIGTAYAALIFLVLTISIGPFNLLTGRRNPISSYIRRDLGIWTALLALSHVVVGLQLHYSGQMWLYFVYPLSEEHSLPLRFDRFGLTNHAGLIAALIFLMLLVLSNNMLLKRLGPKRWKRYHRWNYLAVLLVMGHGVLYQWIEKRNLIFILIFSIAMLIAVSAQVAGYRKFRQRHHTDS